MNMLSVLLMKTLMVIDIVDKEVDGLFSYSKNRAQQVFKLLRVFTLQSSDGGAVLQCSGVMFNGLHLVNILECCAAFTFLK